jgi:DHA2 family multidrug resistance protein-like MFS transporter
LRQAGGESNQHPGALTLAPKRSEHAVAATFLFGRQRGVILLTQVPTSNGLVALVIASVIISLGLAPVFGLTSELIVGSAPPERAGAASGISETGAELGGALGLALLGSIGVAIEIGRRHEVLAVPARLQWRDRVELGQRDRRQARQRDDDGERAHRTPSAIGVTVRAGRSARSSAKP